jgi:hypothetical protein
MANIYGKGARKKATILHSLIVRTRAGFVCQHCGNTREDSQIQCAHIVSRNYGHTRTDLDNAFALCAKCHWRFGKWPVEFTRFIFATIGEEEYDRIAAIAEAGKGSKVDWDAEIDRLQTVLDNMDVVN